MKKIALLILLTSTNLHPSPLIKKTRAYLKIGYGITALLAGVASPLMGGYHYLSAKILAEVSNTLDKTNDRIDQGTKGRPLLNRLLSFTRGAREGAELAIDAQVTLQKVSSGFYLMSPLFFIPLGIRAIKQGREELKELPRNALIARLCADKDCG